MRGSGWDKAGEPVVNALRRAGLGCEITAVTITGGERQSRGGAVCGVPKQDLIEGVQMAMEKRELRVARRLRVRSTGEGDAECADYGRAGDGEGADGRGWVRGT
jgi:hypothetical protein